jgi:hypothetical protein
MATFDKKYTVENISQIPQPLNYAYELLCPARSLIEMYIYQILWKYTTIWRNDLSNIKCQPNVIRL